LKSLDDLAAEIGPPYIAVSSAKDVMPMPPTTARVIDGVAVAKELRAECKKRVAALIRCGVTPGLAVIVVGKDPASALYVRNKIKACAEVGINSFRFDFSSDASPRSVLELITDLNNREDVHGILVQLPLPPQFSIMEVLRAISVDKDVDGFHLYNVGGLVVGDTVFPPCTPYGVVKLLEHEHIDLEGRNVVVVGASNIVGKPMALMLMQRDATVCICHAKTRDLAQFTILADVLVVAAGQPRLIVPQMVKTGAVVIDVGINRLPNGKLVGDVDFEGVSQKASYITPVPGGVGPMTVTMLLSNTIAAAERRMSAQAVAIMPSPVAAEPA
jgi:methylenetetrahydrofolate dehydrogenase (NADP+)/methenyltetrahydrofolate cyclohydrolase